jgi:hypothetical protein
MNIYTFRHHLVKLDVIPICRDIIGMEITDYDSVAYNNSLKKKRDPMNDLDDKRTSEVSKKDALDV